MAILSSSAPRTGDAAAPEPPLDARKPSTGLWGWPALATLVMAMYRMGEPLLGRDELTSWDMSGRTYGQVLATVQHVDAVLGTYYLLLHTWTSVFGDSARMLRMPSALAMVGAAACIALVGRRLFGDRAGMIGGLLFALIPGVSRFAHEARPYGLAMLAVTLSALLLLRALDRPGSPSRWAGYALGLVAVGLFHLLALTCLFAHLALVLLRARRERHAWWGFGGAVLVCVAGLIPVVMLGRAQTTRQIWWITEPGGWDLINIWSQLFYSGLFAGVALLLALLACRERRDSVVFCAVWAVVPVLLIWGISHGHISYFYFRYMLFTLPACAMAAGAGLAAAVRSRNATIALFVAVGLLTISDQRALRNADAHYGAGGPDFVGAARTIQKFYVPGDAVIYNRVQEEALSLGVNYYLPRDMKMRDVFVARSPVQRDDLAAIECRDPARCLRSSEKRIWLVVAGNAADPLFGLPPVQAAALRAHYTPSGAERSTGLTVSLLIRNKEVPDKSVQSKSGQSKGAQSKGERHKNVRK